VAEQEREGARPRDEPRHERERERVAAQSLFNRRRERPEARETEGAYYELRAALAGGKYTLASVVEPDGCVFRQD
jgi:hypothetical protein